MYLVVYPGDDSSAVASSVLMRSGHWQLKVVTAHTTPAINTNIIQCDSSPHDTRHLFNCHADPTNLTVIDLLIKLILAAEILKLTDDDKPTKDP